MRTPPVAFLLLALASTAGAADCPELLGKWGYGPVIAVAVSGNYAYFGSGTMLLVADLANALVRGDLRTLVGVPIAAALLAWLLRPRTRERLAPS